MCTRRSWSQFINSKIAEKFKSSQVKSSLETDFNCTGECVTRLALPTRTILYASTSPLFPTKGQL